MINTRTSRIIIFHMILLVILTLYLSLVKVCVIHSIFGFPCPFCGMTRAYLSAFNFDFQAAFMYHPLWLFIPPYLFVCFHPKIFRLNRKKSEIVIISGAIIIFVTYIIRITTGVIFNIDL